MRRFSSNLKKQKGVVLLIALIALIAMMAASIALSNSVETGTVISTNRFIAQSSQSAADVGYALMKNKIMTKIGSANSLKADNVSKALQERWECFYPFVFTSSPYKVEKNASKNLNNVNTQVNRKRLDGDSDLAFNAFVTRDGMPIILVEENPTQYGVCKETTELDETIYYMADLQCPDARKVGFTENCIFPNDLYGKHDAGKNTVEYPIGIEVKSGKVQDPNQTDKGIGFRGYGNEKIPSFAVPLIRVSVRVDGPRGTRYYRQQMISLFQNPAKK